jgi:hypothetical protein
MLVIFLSELESKVGKPLLRFATKRFGFGLDPPTLGDGIRVFLCVKRPTEGPERIWLLDIPSQRGMPLACRVLTRISLKPGSVTPPGFLFGEVLGRSTP